MITTIRNAWKIPELRKKLMFTLLILFIYRIGNRIPVPYVDVEALRTFFDQTLSNTVRLHVPRNKKYPLRNRNGYKLFAWHTGISVSGSGRNLGSSRYPDLFPIGTSQ